MPDNGLAPPNMPWLFGNRPVGQPNGLGPPMLNYAAPPSPTSQGAGVAAAGQQAWQWLQDQRAESTRQGLLDPDTGLPTQKGVVEGLRDTAQGVMMGTTAPGEMAPIEVSGGLMRGQSNIIRFREDADAIQSALPPVPEGHTRLWRGNRPDEVGTNQQFTSDLPGIALPFRESYGGPISYVDVPANIVENHLQRDFAAPGVEYWVPPDIAKQAQAVHVTPRERPGALNYPSNPTAPGDVPPRGIVAYHGSPHQ